MFQDKFIEQLIVKTGSKHEAAKLIQEQLHIAKDAAYRRLRGSTAFHPNEIASLAKATKISLDNIIGASESDLNIDFTFTPFDVTNPKYLSYFYDIFMRIYKTEGSNMTFVCKRIPYLYSFLSPIYLMFNVYFISKIITGLPPEGIDKFSTKSIDRIGSNVKQNQSIGLGYTQLYYKINSIHIMNNNSIDDDILRIKYCFDSGLFATNEDAIVLLEDLSELLKHMQKEASLGKKFFADEPDKMLGDLQVYRCEAINLEYLVYTDFVETEMALFINNAGDYLATSNKAFVQKSKQYINSMKKLSSKISAENEKERNQMFNAMQDKISRLTNYISASTVI